MKKRKSGTEFEGEGEPQQQEVLSHVVKDASLYTAINTPGSLQPTHLFPPFSGELVLLSLPHVQMNPLELINNEVVVGGRKDGLIVVGGQRYRMTTYPSVADNTNLPSLFLPDQDGHLTKVAAEIKGCVVVKGDVEEREQDEKNCLDIEALRCVHYQTPKHIHKRDFFTTKSRTREMRTEKEKPVKNKKNISIIKNHFDNSQVNGETQTPKKKKKNLHVLSKARDSENTSHAEEMKYPLKKKIKKEKV